MENIAKRPGNLMTSIQRFFAQLESYSRLLIAGLGLLVAIAVGLGFYLNHRADKAEEGRAALFEAQQAFEKEFEALKKTREVVAAPEKNAATKTKKEEAQPKKTFVQFEKLDVKATYPQSLEKYQNVLKNFGSTPAAKEVHLRLANLYFDHGQAQEALPHYEAALKMEKDSFLRTQLLFTVGSTLENLGQYGAARDKFKGASDGAKEWPELKAQGLLAIARTYEAEKNIPEAQKIYDEILRDHSQTPQAKTAEIRRDLLK